VTAVPVYKKPNGSTTPANTHIFKVVGDPLVAAVKKLLPDARGYSIKVKFSNE
jgi:hypothetical protein